MPAPANHGEFYGTERHGASYNVTAKRDAQDPNAMVQSRNPSGSNVSWEQAISNDTSRFAPSVGNTQREGWSTD